jgi:acetolactate synthase small subunit
MSADTLAKVLSTEDPETPDPAAEDLRRRRVACYSIRAAADPGLMSRVLELFAKRGLVPERWHADLTGPQRDELSIDVQVAGLDTHTSGYIAACLRQIWGVEAVLTSDKHRADPTTA